jgi:hypothetical protein
MSAPPIRRSVALNILTGTRGALGAVALLAPRIGARIFRIDAAGSAIVMGRLFGIRNIALAASLRRLDAVTNPRSFLGANVLIDLVDATAFVAAGRRAEIGVPATVLGTVLALTGAALGATGFASVSAPQGGAR